MSDRLPGAIEALDSASDKKYVAGGREAASFKYKSKYVSPDEQLVSFAEDTVGMSSDCFILYAVAWLGIATRESIVNFLDAKRKMGSGLMLIGKDSLDRFLISRIRVLTDRGFLYSCRYVTRGDFLVQMYGVTDSGFDMMRQRLRKTNFANNHAFAYKPPRELIEWAGAAWVGSRLLSCPRVECDLERTFFSKVTGNFFLPFEFRSRGDGGGLFYVAGFNGNWAQDAEVQTQREHEKWVVDQLNAINGYLTRRTSTGTAVACIVVENSEALKFACRAIASRDDLLSLLDRIVFTGEGIVRQVPVDEPAGLRGAFLKMRLDGGSIIWTPLEGGASFV